MNLTQVRVTWLASVLVGPDVTATAFTQAAARFAAWKAPSQLALGPFAWHHPWLNVSGQAVEPDRSVWQVWLEDTTIVTGQITDSFVSDLIGQMVPIRAAVPVTIASVPGATIKGFAEVFTQPWGAIGAVTADLTFSPAASFEDAAKAIDAARAAATSSVMLGPATTAGTVRDLATSIASAAVAALGAPDAIARVTPQRAQIATVIDADLKDPYADHSQEPEFVQGMYRIAGSMAAGAPFHWLRCLGDTGAGCATGEIRLPLMGGLSQWSQPALASAPDEHLRKTPGVHRNGVLRWAQMMSLQGFLEAQWTKAPNWFTTLRTEYVKLLGRHYGPMSKFTDWTEQAYIELHSLQGLMAAPNVKTPWVCPDAAKP